MPPGRILLALGRALTRIQEFFKSTTDSRRKSLSSSENNESISCICHIMGVALEKAVHER